MRSAILGIWVVFLLFIPLAFGAPIVINTSNIVDLVNNVKLVQKLNTTQIEVSGTDYEFGETAKVFAQVLIGGSPQNNATCFSTVYFPNGTKYVNNLQMPFLDEGIYAIDVMVPNVTGVYPVNVKCNYLTVTSTYNVSLATRVLGGGGGNAGDLPSVDGNYYQNNEDDGDSRAILSRFNVTGITLPNSTVSISVLLDMFRTMQPLDPASDPVIVGLYNYSSNTFVGAPAQLSYTTGVLSQVYTFTTGNLSHFVRNGSMIIQINDTISGLSDLPKTPMSIDRLQVIISGTVGNTSLDLDSIRGSAEWNVKNNFGPIFAFLMSLNTTASGPVTLSNTSLALINNNTNMGFLGMNQSLLALQNNLTSQILNINLSLGNLSNRVIGMNQTLVGMNLTLTNVNILLLQLNTTITSMNSSLGALNGNVSLLDQRVINNTNILLQLNNSFTTINNNILSTNQTVRNLQLNFSQIMSSLGSLSTQVTNGFNNISDDLDDIENQLDDIDDDVSFLQNTVDDVNYNVSIIRDIVDSLNMSVPNFTPLMNALIQLNGTVNGIGINVSNGFSTTQSQLTSVQNNITILQSQVTQTYSFLQDINQNITSIKYTVEGINVSDVEFNVTDLNNSITGLIINTANEPTRFDTRTTLLIILFLLLIVSIFYNPSGYLMLVGMYTALFGLYLIPTTGMFLGLLLLGIGAMFGIGGYYKLKNT